MDLGLVYFGLGAALASVLPGLGSAIGTALVGQVAGPILERSEGKFGNLLVLEALPGTQGIYGLLVAVLMIAQSGALSNQLIQLTEEQGLRFVFASLPIAIVGFASAVFQGKLAAIGAGIVDKKQSAFGQAITMAAMVETFAILALLVSVLLVMFWTTATPVAPA